MTDLSPKPKPTKRSQTTAKANPPELESQTPPPAPKPAEIKTEIPPAPTPQVEGKPKPAITAVPALDMQELWDIACKYGKVRVYQWDDRKIGCRIEMIDSDGIELIAKSDFDHTCPCEALQLTIRRARSIKGISVEGGAE